MDAEAQADVAVLQRAVEQAEPLVLEFSEMLFDAVAAANKRLAAEEERLAHDRRAAAKTRHVEEHAMRFEVRVCQEPTAYDLAAQPARCVLAGAVH